MARTHWLWVLIVFCALFLLTPQASAQVTHTGPYNQIGDDPCAGAATPDECMAAGSTTPCRLQKCPGCALNEDESQSICFYLEGSFGYCTCKGAPAGRRTDGSKYPKCVASGSCGPIR